MTCFKCKNVIRGPKIIVEGMYWCSECIYFMEKGMQNPRASK